MELTLDFLNEKLLPAVHRTLQESFADYPIDMSYMTERRLRYRSIKNNVQFSSSVGVFLNRTMKGFTLIGIGEWDRCLTAFDAGTGIVPKFRGQGLAKKMLDFAVPHLQTRGVKNFMLEVLQENTSAVRAYQKSGFQIKREFDCYERPWDQAGASDKPARAVIGPIDKKGVTLFENHVDWRPSWENSFAAIGRIPDDLIMIGASIEGEPAGILVYDPLLNWIMSLVVKKEHRRKGIATHLLNHFLSRIPKTTPSIKLINVEHTDAGMTVFLEKSGFRLYTRQYEMVRVL